MHGTFETVLEVVFGELSWVLSDFYFMYIAMLCCNAMRCRFSYLGRQGFEMRNVRYVGYFVAYDFVLSIYRS